MFGLLRVGSTPRNGALPKHDQTTLAACRWGPVFVEQLVAANELARNGRRYKVRHGGAQRRAPCPSPRLSCCPVQLALAPPD